MIRKGLAVVAGAAITLNILSVDDIGASNEVSLQAPEMEITTAEPVYDLPPSASFVRISETSFESGSSDNVEDHTLIITADPETDDIENRDDDSDSFIHDGSHMWVGVDLANIRSLPDVESDIVDQIAYSSPVIRISYGEEWSLVRTDDGTHGYIMTSLLSDSEIALPTATPTPVPTATPVPSPANTPVPVATPTPTVTPVPSFTESEYNATVYASDVINVRSGPGTEYPLVNGYNTGDAISVTALTSNGWYKTQEGYYVKADLCLDSAPVSTIQITPITGVDTYSYSDFANFCLQYVGTPYVYSGASPSGFDCSGFVSYVYANYYGISLPHNAAEIAVLGAAVSPEAISEGDIICHDYNNDGYIDHVSLYIGGGMCIHASNSRVGVVTSAWPMGSVVTIRRLV